MANNVRYLSYEGLEYFWKNKLKPLIETNKEIVATALTNLDDRLNTHTHSYVASAGYVATAANAVTAGRALYSGSAGYAATADVASKVILSSIITASRSSYLITADGEGKSIGDIMALADALVFKGVITSNDGLPTTHKIGWTYRVNATNTYAGQKCERGDLVICIADGTSANNRDWTIAQTNVDGVVSGPASSVSGNIAAFNSTTGKTIYDTGLKLSNVATSGHSHSNATTSAAGFMSAEDKSKLNKIADNANNYTHPSTHPASIITGTLSVSNGGTGLSSLPDGHIILGTNTTTATSIKFVSISTAQINTIFGS